MEAPSNRKSRSPHKSVMLKKQPLSSSTDKNLENSDKKSTSSLLRTSGRIEQNEFSSSPISKISSNSSTSNGMDNKEETNGKLKDADKQSEDKETFTKCCDLTRKRKMLEFPNYRSFLRPLAKRANSSGTTHFTSIPSSGTKCKITEENRWCCEFHRVQSDLLNSEMYPCNSGTPFNSPTSSLEMGSLKPVCPYTESAGTTTLVHPYWDGWTGAIDTMVTTVDLHTRKVIGVNRNSRKFYLHGHLLFLSAGNSTMCEEVMRLILEYLDHMPSTSGLDLLHLKTSKEPVNHLQSWAMQEHWFFRELYMKISIVDKNYPFYYYLYELFKRSSNAYLEASCKELLEKELKSSKDVPGANLEFAKMCEFDDPKSSVIKAVKVMSESAEGDEQTGGHALVFQGGPSHDWDCLWANKIPLKEKQAVDGEAACKLSWSWC